MMKRQADSQGHREEREGLESPGGREREGEEREERGEGDIEVVVTWCISVPAMGLTPYASATCFTAAVTWSLVLPD